MRSRLSALVGLALLAVVAACSAPLVTNRFIGTLVIYASASLTEPMNGLANAFETANPGLDVQVTYGGDDELAARSPAPDLLALEGSAPFGAVATLAPPVRFASNQLVLAIPPTNPHGIVGLTDLARTDLKVELCDPAEPCGAASQSLLTASGVSAPTATPEPDTRTILADVAAGRADVGLVYRSDVRLAGMKPTASPTAAASPTVATGENAAGDDAAGDDDDPADALALALEVIGSRDALVTYNAAIPTSAPDQSAAQAFLDYLTSAPVLDALVGYGFQSPPPATS